MDFETRLNEIKREAAAMRDKAVSAKTIQEQSMKQMENIIDSIISNIADDDAKVTVRGLGDAFLEDVADDDKSSAFFGYINEYISQQEQAATETIERIASKIEEWKAQIG